MKFFALGQVTFVNVRNDILPAGDARVEGELLHLRRTGPFVPPLTFPSNHVVVTDALRKELEQADLGTFEFRPVVKEHVVECSWKITEGRGNLKLVTSRPPLRRRFEDMPHSPEVADAIGELWQWVLSPGASVDKYQPLPIRISRGTLLVDPASWKGSHFFAGLAFRPLIVSEIGAKWLGRRVESLVRFEPLPTELPTPGKSFLQEARQLVVDPTPEQLAEAINRLPGPEEKKRPRGVTVALKSGWYLSVVSTQITGFANFNDRSFGRRRLYNVPPEKALDLAIRLCREDLAAIEREPWEMAPPSRFSR